MYAVVVTGGKQYRVAPGDLLRVQKINAEVGATVELGPVRLIANEGGVVVAPDALASAKVIAEVVENGRAKKIRVFKMKRRKRYSRQYGHRQDYTQIRIRDIQG